VIGAQACAEDSPPTRTETGVRAVSRYLAAGVFASDFLPEDDDEESDELLEDSFFSEDDELLSEEEPSDDDSLLDEAETPSLDSFISRARFFVP
jgi:hypothetical protein